MEALKIVAYIISYILTGVFSMLICNKIYRKVLPGQYLWDDGGTFTAAVLFWPFTIALFLILGPIQLLFYIGDRAIRDEAAELRTTLKEQEANLARLEKEIKELETQ